jgi:Protein of unknown function (DUF3467)
METSSTDKEQPNAEAVKVHWDDSKMQAAYANVCNTSCTREEFTVLFGTNQTWHAGQRDLTVQLSHRIVLSPFAAKRLLLLLETTIKKYESSFGEIVIQASKGAV